MCGIVGLAGEHGDRLKNNIELMKDRMVHRGPDSEGTYISMDQKVGLGHRRLAIVDLSPSGAQPMTSHNGRYVTVFNGEIYNYRKIKEELEKDHGVAFKGTSDTEVLLEAVCVYGIEETLKKCKGMFAFALYDTNDRSLLLARDRVGEKPLYYGLANCAPAGPTATPSAPVGTSTTAGTTGTPAGTSTEVFAFASDIGSIASIEGFSNEIDRSVLNNYFIYGYIPAPGSIYEGIYKLEPGTYMKVSYPYTDESLWEKQAYWSMKETAKKGQSNKFTGSFEEATDELERLLKASIADQMMADVPVGAFLSAGIDSSTTVALMQSLNTRKVRSFTIGMKDPKYNEAECAAQIAKHLGTEHTELYITEEDAKKVIPILPHMFGEPFADSSQIPTYLVSKMTREHVTVSLSGDGGDELFCGYTSYKSVERIWNKMRKVPYIIRKPISEIIRHTPLTRNEIIRVKSALLGATCPEDLYNLSMKNDTWTGRIALPSPKGDSLCNNERYEKDFLGEINHDIMLMDMVMYHPDDILVKVDRAAMAVSLETRVPMLDRDVVEFAWTLPIEYLREQETGKRVLRNVLYRYVPKEMMDRPKTGFSIPIMKWLVEDKDLRSWAESLLDPALIKKQGLLNSDIIQKMWKDLTERNIWRPQIWYVLMFQQWYMDEYRRG